MSAPALSRALTAAFALHPPVLRTRDMSNEEYSFRNVARTSLLQDSWPHKIRAQRKHFEMPILTLGERIPDEDLRQHEAIITEEWTEFWTAVFASDLIEELDGALDLIYTLLQYLVHRGFPPHVIDAAMEEIHASNMTKVDDSGKPVFVNGKYQKTANYVPANLREAARKATPSFDIPTPTEEPS